MDAQPLSRSLCTNHARFLGLLLLLGLVSATTAAANQKLDRTTLKKLKQATVLLKVRLPDGRLVSGSGFFAGESGLVLTNAHVLGMLDPGSRRPTSVQVVINSGESDSRTLQAAVLGVDPGTDLALLRVSGKKFPEPLKLGTARDLSETDELLVIGFPFGEQLGKNITVTKTTVTSLRKSSVSINRIQVSGGIHPGNSGSPVTNARGEVVGVAVSGLKNAKIQFAIPVDHVSIFLNGRISGMVAENPYRSGDRVMLPVRIELHDPLSRVKKVVVEVWTGNPGPPRPAGTREPKAMPGDSARETMTLSYDRKGLAKGEVKLPDRTNPREVYYVRPVITNGLGETRWLGTPGRTLGEPIERKPIVLGFKPKAGAFTKANLISQASFRLRDHEDEEKSLALNLNAGLVEQLRKDTEQGKATAALVRFSGFRMTLLVDGKPAPKSEALGEIVKNARLLTAEVEIDAEGGITGGKPDVRRVPRESRADLGEIAEQVLQSLEVLSVPLPGTEVKPGHRWKARRHVLLGTLGLAVSALADMEYTYLGTRQARGKPVAVIALGGTVRGARGSERSVGGRVGGTAIIDPETGMVVASSATVSADMDIQVRPGIVWKASGKLAVQANRVPAALKQAPK
jgi:S1-C subfamily serine protease